MNSCQKRKTMIEQWEYATEFIGANIESQGIKEYITAKYPNWKDPPKFTPETMELHLNRMGEQGWELVHMEPVPAVGKNGDIAFSYGGPGNTTWSHVYFCAFKRRKQYPDT